MLTGSCSETGSASHAGMDSKYLQRRNNYLSAYGTTSGLSQISNAEGAEPLPEITLSETVRKTKCDAARRLNLGSCETMTLPLARRAQLWEGQPPACPKYPMRKARNHSRRSLCLKPSEKRNATPLGGWKMGHANRSTGKCEGSTSQMARRAQRAGREQGKR
jgi:hypothetical protein